MISIICCYSNKSVYEQMLKKSIEKQNIECEIVGIDNTDNIFNSAASALNYGAKQAKGDYFIFAHQDIELYGDNFIQSLVKYIDMFDNSIIGLAGKKNSEGVYTNIRHVDKTSYAGEHRVKFPIEVQTIDECLVAMRKDVYFLLGFDEVTCDNWHLYSVDLCLTALKKGIKTIVVPLEAYHASSGILSKGYWNTMDKLVQKHKNDYTEIYTTCSNINTSSLKYFNFRFKINLKMYLKKYLGLLKA